MSQNIFKQGEIIKVECPFLRIAHDGYEAPDPSEPTYLYKPVKVMSWMPGTKWSDDGYGESYAECHGMGFVVYTIIDTHKLPKPYRERVFYLRSWIDPDDRAFGKKDVKITTPQALRYKINKWDSRTYDVEIVDLTEADKKRLLEVA